MFKLIMNFSLRLLDKYHEAIYVSNNQHRVKFIHYKATKKGKTFAIIQVAMKRSKIKLELAHLASNKQLLRELHPVDACRVAFLANLDREGHIDYAPGYINTPHSCPVIRENPTIKIVSQSFDQHHDETLFTLKSIESDDTITVPAQKLLNDHELLYGLGAFPALTIGHAACADFLRDKIKHKENSHASNSDNTRLKYYHILCALYIGLGLSGISIVRRMFPFHIPFTHDIVPFGAGVIFFPLIFAIQDITTEVYGFARSRHMVWLSIFITILYISYTQLAIHLPSGSGSLYQDNASFAVVFGSIPRQFASLIISMLTGMLLNDFLISRLKIIYGGRYLWARIVFSTMIGEAVLNIIGLIIGFGDIMHFRTQILPNIALSYGYKLLWNVALIPFIYLITGFLKKQEGIDVYDYDTNYNPFIVT